MTERTETKKGLSTAAWIIILAVLFCAALVCALVLMNGQDGAASVAIYRKGECVIRLPLYVDTEYRVETASGINIVEVKNGQVRVLEADCPDQTCMKTGWTKNSMMPIVCLPHELIIRCEDTVVLPEEPDIIAY